MKFKLLVILMLFTLSTAFAVLNITVVCTQYGPTWSYNVTNLVTSNEDMTDLMITTGANFADITNPNSPGSFTGQINNVAGLGFAEWTGGTLAPGNSLLFSFTGPLVFEENPWYANGSGGGSDNGSVDSPTLPITLSSFSAMCVDGSSMIKWTTQSESNLSGYNILRGDGLHEESTIKLNSELIQGTNTSSTQHYSFEDGDVEIDSEYLYWLESVDNDGSTSMFGPVSVKIEGSDEPDDIVPDLDITTQIQNVYPNPFNPTTTIKYYVSESSNIEIEIFNVRGQIVTSFEEGLKEANHSYKVIWNGQDSFGEKVSSGVYYLRLKSDTFEDIKKTMLLK